MSNDGSWDATPPPSEQPKGIVRGTGGPKTQPKDWDNPATRGQRRASVQGAKKLTEKLNKLVSDTLRYRDAELRKVQRNKQTLPQYLSAVEKQMLQSDIQWRNYLLAHVKDPGGIDKLTPKYVQSVAGFMSRLQRPNGSE